MTVNHQSPIFELSDKYITELADLSPITATFLGVSSGDQQLDDFSLDGADAKLSLAQGALEELTELNPQSEIDRVAKAVMQERLESRLTVAASREEQIRWSVVWSPAMEIRQIFEIMPFETEEQINNITARLNAVEDAMASWVSCVRDLAADGKVTSQRQTAGVALQLDTFARGAYSGFAMRIDPDAKHTALHEAGSRADVASGNTAQWLKNEYAPHSSIEDAVGEERYAVWARNFSGAQLDLRATYEWGLEDLARINERMWDVATEIKPGAKSLREVADHLDADPRYLVKGAQNLIERLKLFTQAAVEQMDGAHFDIDDRIKFCDARLAPEGSAAAPYYQSPSEDLTRPGTTWFPTLGKDEFSWWKMPSIWYHEAVPGHHLQIATATLERERLSRFQRTLGNSSGYCEGWALYAERLMDELGAFDDPGVEMGYLSAQAMRAVRVVVDIGMHLGYQDPSGQFWNARSARELMVNQALLDEPFAASEIDRYLGMPGQAISYKVGERVWMRTREEASNRLGANFSLKKFHSHALKLGPMGLDPLKVELSHWDGS